MAPKNTYLFNIPFSALVLIFLFSIFFNVSINPQSAENKPQTFFSALKPFNQCLPLIRSETSSVLPASDNKDVIYVLFADGFFESINLPTRTKMWRTELGGKIISKMILDLSGGKTIYLATQLKSGIVWAINAETGITKWQAFISSPQQQAFLYLYQNILTVVYTDGKIVSIDKETGGIRWIKSIGSDITSQPSFVSDRVFLSGSDKKIISADLNDGTIINRLVASNAPNILLALNKTDFLWSDQTGNLFFKEKKRFRAGAEISDLAVTSRGILIASKDNFLYLISDTKQKLLWKKKLAGRVFPKPLIIDRWAIVPVLGESDLSVIDLENGKIINRIPIEKENYFVGEFFISSEFLFIPTAKGLYIFASADTGCW